jgi:predicted MFS family arabinose efflux permease
MAIGWWALVWLVVVLALAAACGLWQDVTHRPRRERLLARSEYDVRRARTMSGYYASIHGSEW